MSHETTTFEYDDVFHATLEYFSGDEMATNIWMSKYALKTQEGLYLERTPTDMHRRLAHEFARIEKKYPNAMHEQEIFDLLDRFQYVIPQGSPMAGIGNDQQLQSLSNCFVIDAPHDSYGGIMHTDQEQVQIMKRRGGVGFDISALRPHGVIVKNAAQSADGIDIFMNRFSNTCREVAQGGRRGALMLSISCHHSQLESFINVKRDLSKVTGANISVRVTDEFMHAVENREDVQLRWPVDTESPVISDRKPASELWNSIIASTHVCAEPGLLFWDNIIRNSPADIYSSEGFETVSTNPCGELPLAAYDSCRLLVVNASSFVDDAYTSSATFNWVKYAEVIQKAQKLMDDLIDLELEVIEKIIDKIDSDPEPEHIKHVELNLWSKIRDKARIGRRTGLGITAIGDVIAMLGMRYGSDESIELVDDIYKYTSVNSYISSIKMARDRGCFEICDPVRELDSTHSFLTRVAAALPKDVIDMWRSYGRRNIANLTTAPCGSLSIMTQTTAGIEPAIYRKYVRRKKVNADDKGVRVDSIDDLGDAWMHFDVSHHGVSRWLLTNGWTQQQVNDWVASSSVDKMTDDLPQNCPYIGSTATEIDWKSKLRLQSAAQQWIDHAISNTINLPNDVSIDTVKELYMLAWKLSCKGVTIYREGSRVGVMSVVDDDNVFVEHHAPKRQETLPCEIHRAKIKGEEWTIFVGLMDGRPYEVFGGLSELLEIPRKYEVGFITKRSYSSMGSKYDLTYGQGDDVTHVKDIVKVFDNPDYSFATRLLSTMLRHGTPVQYVVEQLQKDKKADLISFARVMARTLKKYIKDKSISTNVCHVCGSKQSMVYIQGCEQCLSCGSAVCG